MSRKWTWCCTEILGLAVLEHIFADRDLDFFALLSLAALWGGEGQVDYAAANAQPPLLRRPNVEESKWKWSASTGTHVA